MKTARYNVELVKEASLKVIVGLALVYFSAFITGYYTQNTDVLGGMSGVLEAYTPHKILEVLGNSITTAYRDGASYDVIFSMIILASALKSLLYSIHALIPLLPPLTLFIEGYHVDVAPNSYMLASTLWIYSLESLSLSLILAGVISTFREKCNRHFLAYGITIQYVISILEYLYKLPTS